VSHTKILEISPEQQDWMLRELRRCRYGYFLSLHILLLYVGGRTPSEISKCLFCSRSSVYRAIDSWNDGKLKDQWWPDDAADKNGPTKTTSWLGRKLLQIIKQPPRVFGWCRTRWSCAALALTIAARTGFQFSRETIRCELRSAGYVWKRAKLKAKDDDPQRVRRLAEIRAVIEQLQPSDAFFWCDELDVHLLAKVGYQWMFKGTQVEIPTPGKNQKQYLAAALDYRTGQIHYVIGNRKDNALFRELLQALEKTCEPGIKRIFLVLDNYKIHKAKAVDRWLEQHPRFHVRWLPTYCPQANPIERAFGDVHDKCTRNHTRQSLRWLLWDVKQHFKKNGPWTYKVPDPFYEPEVEAELIKLRQNESLELAT
jgi:putative transposase